ncbi:MAG: hypothetical protein ABEJ87_01895 [Candidatus Nanohalobium sp.]
MELRDWAGMATYGLSVLFLMSVFLTGSAGHEASNVSDVKLVQKHSQTSFDTAALELTVSGNASVSGGDAGLRVNSTSFRNDTLRVDLDAVSQNLSRDAPERSLNYSLKVGMGSQLPDRVLVYGPSGRTDLFRPES